jgi:hypothetical protein
MDKKMLVAALAADMTNKILIILIMIVGLASASKCLLAAQEDSSDIYQESCGDIRNVKSIVVNDDKILIEFYTNSEGFQDVDRREKDNTIVPLERGSNFTLKIGNNISWGDSDHGFVSIVLDDIKEKVAFVTIGEEQRPPVTQKDLEYNQPRKCKIDHRYSR